MLALLFLFFACLTGHRIVLLLLGATIDRVRSGRELQVPRAFLVWPASFLTGSLLLSWIAYLSALSASGTSNPLGFGDSVALFVGALASYPDLRRWFNSSAQQRRETRVRAFAVFRRHLPELVVLGAFSLGAALMMRATLFINHGTTLNVGLSVFSDFGPHLAMIRSFSQGSNFPTQYPHFPDGTIRYHFLFQFFAGNMEFLGLPIDWAFNVVSLLAFVACIVLLHSFAVIVTGRRAAGVLTVVLFLFRSSLAWWDFAKAGPWYQLPARIWNNELFIGKTEHEDWGLWNQNVYLNQRHLPFGLAVMLLCFIALWPRFSAVFRRPVEGPEAAWSWRRFFFSKEAWLPEAGPGLGAAVLAGLLLAGCSFWNGAAVIATLLVLACFAFVSLRRLEFLLVAVLAGGLGYLENRLFLGPNSLALEPHWNFGFLSEHPKTWAGVFRYYRELLGLMPVVLALGFFAVRFSAKITRNSLRFEWSHCGRAAGLAVLTLVFLSPIVLANTVQLTPEISINHKYIMIGVMLLNIIVAAHLVVLWDYRHFVFRGFVLVLVVALTGTGVIDLFTLLNKNTEPKALVAKLDDPLLVWAQANTKPDAIFLTDWYSIHPVLLSGRKIFYGWPYYAWSAGYDTLGREAIVKKIYGGTNPGEAVALAKKYHITHIVIDNENRHQSLYKLQEAVLSKAFTEVYRNNDIVVLEVR